MAEIFKSRDRVTWQNKAAVECLQTSQFSRFISWRDLAVKLLICVFFQILETISHYCQLYIDYEPNKYIA